MSEVLLIAVPRGERDYVGDSELLIALGRHVGGSRLKIAPHNIGPADTVSMRLRAFACAAELDCAGSMLRRPRWILTPPRLVSASGEVLGISARSNEHHVCPLATPREGVLRSRELTDVRNLASADQQAATVRAGVGASMTWILRQPSHLLLRTGFYGWRLKMH